MHQLFLKLLLRFISIGIFLFIMLYIKKYVNILLIQIPLSKRKTPLFISKILQFGFVFFGLISVFNDLGIDLKNLMAGLGLTSFLLGFALKDIISSIVSGIIIIINDNISIGDIVYYKNIQGAVLTIELRYIVLKTENSDIKHFISTTKLLAEHFSVKQHRIKNIMKDIGK